MYLLCDGPFGPPPRPAVRPPSLRLITHARVSVNWVFAPLGPRSSDHSSKLSTHQRFSRHHHVVHSPHEGNSFLRTSPKHAPSLLSTFTAAHSFLFARLRGTAAHRCLFIFQSTLSTCLPSFAVYCSVAGSASMLLKLNMPFFPHCELPNYANMSMSDFKCVPDSSKSIHFQLEITRIFWKKNKIHDFFFLSFYSSETFQETGQFRLHDIQKDFLSFFFFFPSESSIFSRRRRLAPGELLSGPSSFKKL